MKLCLEERITVTLKYEDKEKIAMAAMAQGQTMSAYARSVLVKDAESIIKKAKK